MARRGYGARLALITPYTSIVDLAATIAPFLPARLLVRDRFDNAAKAPNLDLPVLIVHGTNDEVVPASMGKELSRLFPHATIRLETGAHHNDLLDLPSVTSELLRFAAAQ
jgi:pimeloyl-ACP methyl ester carboxylesterase